VYSNPNLLPDYSAIPGKCPICLKPANESIYQLDSIPVTSASVFSTAENAKAVPRGSLNLSVCYNCGLVFNKSFSSSLAEVGATYESSQAASAHFNAYARSLASEWVEKYNLCGKKVIEVGAARGEFLQELLRAGVAHATGFDPLTSGQPAGECRNLELIPRFFDQSTLDAEGDALVCRHTLEHIPEVGAFLKLVASWAAKRPDRVVLFEVPASERIFSEFAFWDIYYEHCNYFTKRSLWTAFASAGFDVKTVRFSYNDQYLLLEATIGKQPFGAKALAPGDPSESIANFEKPTKQSIRHTRSLLSRLKADGPVIFWQAASKTVGFLSAVGTDAGIQHAIDLNPHRHHNYLPGSGVKIIPPDAILDVNPLYIILMNPVYLNEVRSFLAASHSKARIITVNELCSG
jgi:hypothetical protein